MAILFTWPSTLKIPSSTLAAFFGDGLVGRNNKETAGSKPIERSTVGCKAYFNTAIPLYHL